MFHFTLVHVPGMHHGSDKLSRQRPQPGDKKEPQDDFEDWIDNVNGFMHFLNPYPTSFDGFTTMPPIATYITNAPQHETKRRHSEAPGGLTTTPYSIVPQSEAANNADIWLARVQIWLETLRQPDDKTFMCYCTEFAVISGKLWRKDPKEQHKKVVPQVCCLFLITTMQDDVGHHGVYAITALLTEQYWWPYMVQDFLHVTFAKSERLRKV